ncbi:Crp/Fnr family transcriptional regulator [Streptomyces sp. NPDC053048]|uniref:Crp/Fnr family transcriptional regulator n=1 Tax=Streptomyces sp. NPDC053048 TaxID=3365694 RepID=UPI0037D8F9A3
MATHQPQPFRNGPPIWRDLIGEALWNDLLEKFPTRWHPHGEQLMAQDERGRCVMALISGQVKVIRNESNGAVTLFAIRGPGELLGEVAVQDGGLRLANVVALSRCRVAVMSAPEFRHFVRSNRLESPLNLTGLARWRETTRIQGRGDALFRLAEALLRFAAVFEPSEPTSVNLRLTRTDLAQHLAVSRNLISELLADLHCWVRTGHGHIHIHDLPGLRDFVALHHE